MAVFNDGSLSAPTGSMALVELDVTPLVGLGQSVQLTLSPCALLRPDGSAFPQSSGFSAVVVVTSPAPLVNGGDAPPTLRHRGAFEPWVDPLWGAVPLRRPGHVLSLSVQRSAGMPPRRRVETYDPFAASER